jgi:hypothetical protein
MTNTPVQTPEQVTYVKAPSNGLATASLVLGIIGTVLALIPVIGVMGAVIGGIGLVLGIFGLLAAKKRGAGKGKSIAGLVLGAAAIVVFLLVSAATVAAVDTAVKSVDKGIADRTDTSAATDVSDNDEIKDAKLGKPVKDMFGVSVKVTITNSSKNKSDYLGTVVFESANGKTQYGTGPLLVDGLEPGQTKVEKVMMLDELPKNAKAISVRLTDFDRSQSF